MPPACLLAASVALLNIRATVHCSHRDSVPTVSDRWPTCAWGTCACVYVLLLVLQVKLDPRFVSGDTPPLSNRSFLLRLLNNLRQIYVTLNMAEEALAIVR